MYSPGHNAARRMLAARRNGTGPSPGGVSIHRSPAIRRPTLMCLSPLDDSLVSLGQLPSSFFSSTRNMWRGRVLNLDCSLSTPAKSWRSREYSVPESDAVPENVSRDCLPSSSLVISSLGSAERRRACGGRGGFCYGHRALPGGEKGAVACRRGGAAERRHAALCSAASGQARSWRCSASSIICCLILAKSDSCRA